MCLFRNYNHVAQIVLFTIQSRGLYSFFLFHFCDQVYTLATMTTQLTTLVNWHTINNQCHCNRRKCFGLKTKTLSMAQLSKIHFISFIPHCNLPRENEFAHFSCCNQSHSLTDHSLFYIAESKFSQNFINKSCILQAFKLKDLSEITIAHRFTAKKKFFLHNIRFNAKKYRKQKEKDTPKGKKKTRQRKFNRVEGIPPK